MLVTIQNLVFWPLFLAASAIYIPVATLIIAPIGLLAPRRFAMHRLRRTITWYGRLVIWCAWPFVRVKYKDLKPEEKDGSYIFICNHRSSSDPFLMACLPFECVQIVNDWPLELPILGWLARLAGYIDIMNTSIEEFYEHGSRLLNQGACICSFPEGTRSGSQQMGPFTSSVFRLAIRNHATLVPLAITGNENIPHKGSWILHPGLIRVDKLPAVTWDEYADMDAFHLKNHVQQILQEHIDRVEGDAA
ncbi:MAG: lysophospholipid acyltransferase family protein [Candidatus Brocadiia bacterium]